MKVLLFLTFFCNTVFMHKYFPSYESAYKPHSFDYDINIHYEPPSYYLEPPAREHPRALPIQNHQNYHNKPAGPHVQARQTLSKSSHNDPNEIVMPPSEHENEDVPFNVTGENCQFNLCDEAFNYPEEYITNFLKSTNDFDSFFNAVLPDIVSKNFGDENICQSSIMTSVPKTGINTRNESRIIANVDGYTQAVNIELCDKKGTPCQFSESRPLGLETICEQRYTIVPLMAFDNDKKPRIDTFQLPSCCVCMYKKA